MSLRLALLAAALVLAACSDLRGDYDLPAGDANYDALQTAVAACKAKGGSVALKSGYDDRQLSSYRCHIGKEGR